MERILKESFIFNVFELISSLYRDSFFGKVISFLSQSFKESFIFSLLSRFGNDVDFNIKTGLFNFKIEGRDMLIFLFFLSIPLSFFIPDWKIRIITWIIIYLILFFLIFEREIVKRSFIFKAISGYLSEKLPFYIISLYPLIDFFIRKNFSSISPIWDEGFLLFLFIFLFLFIKRKSINFTEIINPVLLFLFFLVLSFSKSVLPLSAGIDGIRSYLEMFLFFLITVNFIDDKEDIKRLINVFLISMLIISIYAIYQFIVKVPIPPSWVDKDLETGITTRAFSIFTSPNALSGYLILLLPLTFILSLIEKGAKKYLYLSITAISLLALLFTLTRASWLSLFIAFFIFSLVYKDKRIFIVLILLILSSYFIPEVRRRFMNLLSPVYIEKAKTYGRIYRWNLAIEIFKRKPIFGVGPGGFGGAVASRIGFFEGIYVDNYYLKTLVETGIFGFLSFLYMLFTMIKRGIATVINKEDEFLKYAALGITLGVFAFLINNITENLWEVVPLSATMWTEIGILFSIRRLND